MLLKSDLGWPGPSMVNFIHNWRCAGTSVNSILSSNFSSHYLKIGHPFNKYGWPESYSNHRPPIVSLGHIRTLIDSNPSSYLLGGHSFLGLESFLCGSSDVWMNFRDPLSRLNSGIYRFYSKYFHDGGQPNSNHLHKVSEKHIDFTSPDSINHLLENSLLRESNGMARRLSALTLSDNFHITDHSNLEKLEILTCNHYNDKDLLEASILNLGNVKVLINSKWLQPSLLCIEKIYNLSSPLINPFSDLRHNPVTLSNISRDDTRLMDHCRQVLLDHSTVDRALFPYMNRAFAKQVNENSISLEDVAVRDAIHFKGLLNEKWFPRDNNDVDLVQLVQKVGTSYAVCCKNNPELSDAIFNTLMSWNIFDENFRMHIAKYCRDKYSIKSTFA